ncbi:phorbol-12-myristate-13-acetate-induced protein 1 [Alligator mississippiensis]|uniref:phorbol-12-myristate-13-acetate-induced protein 1 n=1 Tax=Alligator mississippiensis TaxID=8496 RepID=UPI0003D07C86|nr:phorbol-12-myristate-13-acetate-induced protein 1 [Alligator mississippiensis]
MMPGRTCRKAAPQPSEREAVRECALQLRRIGDQWHLHQKILSLIAKLFRPGT